MKSVGGGGAPAHRAESKMMSPCVTTICAAFASLPSMFSLRKLGEDMPCKEGLAAGFPFRGQRVPFLSPQKGILRAVAQRGPGALSINTSYKSPYGDEETPEGVLYAYRAGDVSQPDNRALRAAFELQAPLVYFVGTRPG